jgi:hypothetical protein
MSLSSYLSSSSLLLHAAAAVVVVVGFSKCVVVRCAWGSFFFSLLSWLPNLTRGLHFIIIASCIGIQTDGAK